MTTSPKPRPGVAGAAASSADVVVVGAGVIGGAVALELARRGLSVVVVDQGPGPGMGSTSSSSAVVRFNYSTRDGVALAWEALHYWLDWPDHIGVDDEAGLARFHRVGLLAFDPPGREEARTRMLGHFDNVGVAHEILSPDEIAARFPAVDAGRYFPPRPVDDERFWDEASGRIDACFTPDAGFVDDPQLAARNLMTAAVAAGADFRFRTSLVGVAVDDTNGDGVGAGRVSGVELLDRDGRTASIDAPVVINCAGPHSAAVNRLAGVLDDFAVTTRPLRQEVHVVEAPPGFGFGSGGTMVADPDLGTYFRTHLGDTVLVGSVEPECDPLHWVDDADDFNPNATVEAWQAQVYRLARRLPELGIPHRPTGLAALYDASSDWLPIYDRTALDGFYVAIGTSGNQFKCAPMVGRLMAELVVACEAGHDHDVDPLVVDCLHTGLTLGLGQFSRRRVRSSATSVLG